MALVEKSVLIGQSAERMFELVDRCEDYPVFLPWCSQTEVKYRDALKTVATLHVNYHSVKTSFTTENDKESAAFDADSTGRRAVSGASKVRGTSGRWRKVPARSSSSCTTIFPARYSKR
jgi:ribosome-associated toxin RatA of RatAB toxin-antitoxin module